MRVHLVISYTMVLMMRDVRRDINVLSLGMMGLEVIRVIHRVSFIVRL